MLLSTLLRHSCIKMSSIAKCIYYEYYSRVKRYNFLNLKVRSDGKVISRNFQSVLPISRSVTLFAETCLRQSWSESQLKTAK